MASTDDYIDAVTDRLLDDGFEPVEELPEDTTFDVVYARRVKALKLGGMAYKFVAFVNADDVSGEAVWHVCEDLREIMTGESVNVFGIGENALGYVVVPQHGLSEDLRRLITESYENQKGTASVFPIGVDLDGGEVVTAPVPAVRARPVFSTQKRDAETYFAL